VRNEVEVKAMKTNREMMEEAVEISEK